MPHPAQTPPIPSSSHKRIRRVISLDTHKLRRLIGNLIPRERRTLVEEPRKAVVVPRVLDMAGALSDQVGELADCGVFEKERAGSPSLLQDRANKVSAFLI